MRWLFCVAWRVKWGRTRWGRADVGERTERCRWQRKRSERVAAVKILSVRRKAAQKFWAPQQGHRPLRKRVLRCVGEGLCPSRGRGNRRSAAGGGCSEPVSRKCPDLRTRQWPGIGWHDGGQENPAPTEALQEVQWAGDRKGRPYESVYKECDAVRNPPVTASPCQPPLGKGAIGTGVRIATASVRTGLAMTLVFHGGAVCGGAHGPRPTRVFAILRADRGVRPYAKQGDANKHGRAG